MKVKFNFMKKFFVIVFCLLALFLTVILVTGAFNSNESESGGDSLNYSSSDSILESLSGETLAPSSYYPEYWKDFALEMNIALPENDVKFPRSEFESIKEGTTLKEVFEKFGVPKALPTSGVASGVYTTFEGDKVIVDFSMRYNLNTNQDESVVLSVEVISNQ